MFYVYILESLTNSLFYVGQTNNLTDRLKRHNKGTVKSTKSKGPYKLVYFEEFETRAGAMHREWEIKKKYNTNRKKKLISSFKKSKLTTYTGQ
jgi:putative endonuclease